jgi:hypothetical protein
MGQATRVLQPMTIFIIDDHPLFRDAISMLVRKQWPAARVVELDRLGAVAALQAHRRQEPVTGRPFRAFQRIAVLMPAPAA